jgi:response regulator of citrate/malate metabolism
VSLKCDQLILVNKAEKEKEHLEKGLEEEEKSWVVQLLKHFFTPFSNELA